MIARSMVAAAAALFLPLTGTSDASCLDDLRAGLREGHYESPRSTHWNGPGSVNGYVERTGVTVTVYGDALIADHTGYALEWVRYAQTAAGNAPEAAPAFVSCVAG